MNHFGNLRGKNDYRDIKYIMQVGMNRFKPVYYFMYEFDYDPSELGNLMSCAMEGTDCNDHISRRIHDANGFTKQIMDDMLICDIEQNFYRGALRKFDGTPFTYYLFVSFKEYRSLIDKLQKKYKELGASVYLIGKKETLADKFIEWYSSLKIGYEYTNDDIRIAIGYEKNKRLVDFTRKNNKAKQILDRDRVSLGHYVKKE